jgi:hypothetical protein
MKNLIKGNKKILYSNYFFSTDLEFEKIIGNFSFEEKIEARSERCLFFFQF